MFQRILVPTDFSPSAERALALARTHFSGAQLRLLHIVDERALPIPDLTTGSAAPVKPPEDLQRAFGHEDEGRLQLAAQAGEEYELRRGDPAHAIVQAARDWRADLIVMGTHGRRGLTQFFIGSVAERVVRESLIPVLTLRDPHPQE